MYYSLEESKSKQIKYIIHVCAMFVNMLDKISEIF